MLFRSSHLLVSTFSSILSFTSSAFTSTEALAVSTESSTFYTISSPFTSTRLLHPNVSKNFSPVASSTHPPIALATPPENHSLPLCDASLIRSHVIALCAFAISCFSANEGKRASSSAPRYREETSWDVLRREWLRERRRSAGGG